MRRNHNRGGERLFLSAVSAVIASAGAGWVCAPAAWAGPEGATVVHGNASISSSGNTTTITAGNNAVINYQRFNIGAQESVRFVQPDATSRVLNRITGSSPSVIEGRLTANGRVYFLNPNGVLFAPGAVVNVAGLYAASGNLSNNDFLMGVDRFTNLTGGVVNQGRIEAGAIYLMGNSVANHGTLDAGEGVIAMVAGNTVILTKHGDRLSVEVDGTNLASPGSGQTTAAGSAVGVENTGTVKASGGSITLGAGDMYSLAIRNRGTISASSAKGKGGSVAVHGNTVVNSGTISADSATDKGGSVSVTSNARTTLEPGSRISATGVQGGTVMVNSFHGATDVQKGSVVDVSGAVGGWVELSGKTLALAGTIDTRGSERMGSLTIDPTSLTVDGAFVAAYLGGDLNLQADNDITFAYTITVTGNLTVTAPLIFMDVPTAGAGSGPVKATGQQDYFGHVFLNADETTIDASKGTIFHGPIDSKVGVSNDLIIKGPVEFRDNVGAVTPLGNLLVDGGAANFTGPAGGLLIKTKGSQEYKGNANVVVDTTFESETSTVTFYDNVDNGAADGADMKVVGNAVFKAPVTTSKTVMGSLDVTGTTLIEGESIKTRRDQVYHGAVTFGDDPETAPNKDTTLTSLLGDIQFKSTLDAAFPDFPGIAILALNGHVQFGDNVGLTGSPDFITAYAGGNFNKVISLGSVDGIPMTLRATHDIKLNPLGVFEADGTTPRVPTIATIAGPVGDIKIQSLLGSVIFGPRNKATAAKGSLTIEALSGTAAIGDLNAFTDIIVHADTIDIFNRPPGMVRNFLGVNEPDVDDNNAVNGGVDFVANGTFSFQYNTLVGSGTGNPARFGSPNAAPDADGTLGAFSFTTIDPVADFRYFFTGEGILGLSRVLDLRIANLPPIMETATIIPTGPLPWHDRMVREPLLGPPGRTSYVPLAVDTRDLDEQEYQDSLILRRFYNDITQLMSVSLGGETPHPIALNRISRTTALEAMDGYKAIFLVTTTDPQTGKPVETDQTAQVKEALGGAWSAYVKQAGGSPTAAGFNQFIKSSPDNATAQTYVTRLGQFFDAVAKIGVTDLEYEAVIYATLKPITPEGSDVPVMYESIMGKPMPIKPEVKAEPKKTAAK